MNASATARVLDRFFGQNSLFMGHLIRNRFLYAALAVVIPIGVALRVYLNNMAFSTGTDFWSPEFQTYWLPLLYIEIISLGAFTVGLSLWVWFTREKSLSHLTKSDELDRYWTLLRVFTVIGLWAGLIATNAVESDAAWHQVTIRDTDFTPTHILIFYFCLPAVTAMLIPSFIWAHTRLPVYRDKISVPFLMVVIGIVMIMPNYGFNEWGHTFWYAEELFAAPVHWGFVFLGWSVFFFVPLAVQLFTNMARLIAEVTQEPQLP